MGLKEYKAKRNFRRTHEPAGQVRAVPGVQADFFVVQKHDATRLHYDFRLAMEGVLKSWAVPKGFPTTRGDKRLAVEVEDHPMEYANFEGTIPAGNYGAGTVMVWDTGTFEVIDGEPVRALKKGKLHLVLQGKKLKGEWMLVRMRPREHEDKPQWLLIKGGTDIPPFSARADDQSVLTKRSMRQIAGENDAQWQSDRKAGGGSSAGEIARRVREAVSRAAKRRAESGNGRQSEPEPEINLPRLPSRAAEFIEPMKASLAGVLPRGSDWIYEIKFDGVRALAIKKGRNIELFSRNAKDFTGKFPEVIQALRKLPCREAVFDGEIAALDSEGRSSFQLLQALEMGTERPPIFYYVFDLIQLDGRDLTGVPLLRRKAMAQALIANLPDTVRFSASIRADSEKVIREMQARGLEGLIAKQAGSAYEIGRRGRAWVKYKWTSEQEFVIGGFTEPRGTRHYFGAVLVGYYSRGKLIFASKVGTGFDEKLLKALHERFRKIVQPACPFANLPERNTRGALTAAEMRRCTWVKPSIVCQIRFAEWTRDGHLRQPAFLGLREDKDPGEVVRETAG